MKADPINKSSDGVSSAILAVIPAYNEARHIGAVVTAASRHLPVLVVDDGSTDGTAARAENAGAHVLRQTPNQGKGAALKAAFRYALEHNYAAVLTLDADGQHDPSEIPTFLRALQAEPTDLIIGWRDFRRIPPVRRVANSLGRVAFSWALGQSIPDNQSGYRSISRRLMQAALESPEQGFQFEVEIIVLCVLRGYAIGWVPIQTIYADERSHIRPLQHLIEFIRMLHQTRRALRRNRKVVL